jgi:ATP/maltotriose-dependent transcriptional regulator MalT
MTASYCDRRCHCVDDRHRHVTYTSDKVGFQMSTMVTRTRVALPRCPPHLLKRERLLELLLDLLDHRLILVTAPPGYGKTSLLIDFAHAADMPVCWYAIDASDQDPRRFIAHFIASVARVFPTFGRESEAVLEAASTCLNLEQLVSVMVNEAYDHIQEHFLIVLDDYHLVAGIETIDQFINRFVQQAGENCHLILSSRVMLDLPDSPLMAARSQMGGLSAEELAFRADEIQAFMLQNYHMNIPLSPA